MDLHAMAWLGTKTLLRAYDRNGRQRFASLRHWAIVSTKLTLQGWEGNGAAHFYLDPPPRLALDASSTSASELQGAGVVPDGSALNSPKHRTQTPYIPEGRKGRKQRKGGRANIWELIMTSF